MKIQTQETFYSWFVAILCGIIFGINIGYINIYSLIYNEFTVVYNATENNVVYAIWIGSASNGIQYAFCFVASFLVDLFGSRKIGIIGGLLSCIGLLASGFVDNIKLYFVTISFFNGVGQSMMLIAALSILPHYFNKSLGLASGIMNLIGCFVTSSLPFAIEASLHSFGLSKTFFILAGICFLAILCSFAFQPKLPKNECTTFKNRLKTGFGCNIFRSKRFWIWIVCAFIGFFGYLVPIVTMVSLYFCDAQISRKCRLFRFSCQE